MKKILNKSELGSIMIEALAMLALIALVTPLLYKKTSERMRELQDINSASELRAIVKAVDDYISSNYDTMVAGGTVTNNCSGTGNNSQSYSGLTGTNHRATVPIGHFCEFLPYGILNSNGTAKQSKLFSGYSIVLKLQGSATEEGNNVITAFVVTDPTVNMPQLRSSSIASMIGGNGGYVTSNTGDSGTSASQGTISGNLGLWGIDNTTEELGIEVKKGAVVAASIQGISSQNANIDIDDVLYRRSRADKDLNTMFTTLYMGSSTSDSFGNEIQNIGRLVIGQLTAPGNERLYLSSGNIKIGGAGNISIGGTGSVSLTNGNFTTATGNFETGAGNFKTTAGNFETSAGSLLITKDSGNAIQVNTNLFTVAATGVTKALNFQTNDGNVQLNVDSKSTIKQPVVIESSGTCTYANHAGCALTVTGGEYVSGNLIIGGTFNAENLHARTRLTVGGNSETDANALDVKYTESASLLDFASNLFRIKQSGDKLGGLKFADALIYAKKESETKGFFKVTVPDAADNQIGLRTGTSNVVLTQNTAQIGGNSTNYLKIEGASNLTSVISPNIKFNTDAFALTGTNDKIDTLVNTLTVTPKGKAGYFRVNTEGSFGSMYADALNAYFTGKNNVSKSHIYQRDSDYHLRNSGNTTDIVRVSDTAGTSQIDVSSSRVTMGKAGTDGSSANDKIMKIDLTNDTTTETHLSSSDELAPIANYPVYIRKGIIELSGTENHTYVKADRFVARKKTLAGDLRGSDSSAMAETNYIVNPAYTSIMRDIKLTSRGGARLSDILPDFINKGIYVVDNTYPAKGESCGGYGSNKGKSLSTYQGSTQGGALAVVEGNVKGYKKYSDRTDTEYVGQCDSSTQEVSPWLGFVPRPTCPPGYMAVITLTPTSFALAQAGFAHPRSEWHRGDNYSSTTDLYTINNSIKSPLDYMSEESNEDAPIPFYSQKNTWLKSDAVPYPSSPDCTDTDSCKGWDLSMGFIYPYQWYKQYIWEAKNDGSYTNQDPDISNYDSQGPSNDEKVIWNLFPVYAGTLEGYATVYCYFKRNPKNFNWNDSTVDIQYDQIERFRDATDHSTAGSAKTTSDSQNAPGYDYGYW